MHLTISEQSEVIMEGMDLLFHNSSFPSQFNFSPMSEQNISFLMECKLCRLWSILQILPAVQFLTVGGQDHPKTQILSHIQQCHQWNTHTL